MPIDTINLAHKFSLFTEQWSPKIVGERTRDADWI